MRSRVDTLSRAPMQYTKDGQANLMSLVVDDEAKSHCREETEPKLVEPTDALQEPASSSWGALVSRGNLQEAERVD